MQNTKLVTDNCEICERRYSIGLHELPILECSVCGQGVHKPCWLNLAAIASKNTDTDYEISDAEAFKKYYNPLILPGIFYVHECCQPNTILCEDEGNNKRKKSVRLNTPLLEDLSQNKDTRQETIAIKETPNDTTLAQDESENGGENFENNKLFIQDRTKDIGKKSTICRFIEMETANMG